MSRRMLMIADAGGFWTKRYIENLLLPNGWEVVLFPIWEKHGRFDEYYREAGVTVYQDAHTLPVVRHVPRLRMWARIALNARDLQKLGPFDAVHNHYLSQRDLALGDRVRRANPGAKWVCSFWGSDLMRSPEKELRRMGPYLAKCDAITVHSAVNVDMVRKRYGESAADKTSIVYFGQTVYDDIARVQKTETREDCRRHFGFPQDKKIVCIGSNAQPAQKQLELIEALLRQPGAEELFVVLQMSYGHEDEAYEKRIREAAQRLPGGYAWLDQFLDGTESARLRLTADVFVLAIPTDMFSASMQEYLFAGARVVRGGWLRYPQLTELGIETSEFADFDEAAREMVRAARTPLSPDQRARRDELPRRYSWAAVSEGWLRLYR